MLEYQNSDTKSRTHRFLVEFRCSFDSTLRVSNGAFLSHDIFHDDRRSHARLSYDFGFTEILGTWCSSVEFENIILRNSNYENANLYHSQFFASPIYITTKSLEKQRSNAHWNITKLGLALRARTQVASGRPRGRFSPEQAESAVFFVLFIVYPRTSQVVLSMFNCYQIADGSEYVEADFSLECTDDFKKTFWPVAAIYTVIYPIGIPLLILYKLMRHKHMLYDPLTNKPHGVAKQKYGSIYDMYKPSHW